MDDRDRLIAELVGHEIEIATRCACAKVTVFSPGYALERIGQNATLRIMESRMRCKSCRERPRLYLELRWGVADGRDTRRNPPPIPDWASRLMKGTKQ